MSGEYFTYFGRQDVQIKKTDLQDVLKTPYIDYETGATGTVLWPLSARGSQKQEEGQQLILM